MLYARYSSYKPFRSSMERKSKGFDGWTGMVEDLAGFGYMD